jgi:hypothetical protein
MRRALNEIKKEFSMELNEKTEKFIKIFGGGFSRLVPDGESYYDDVTKEDYIISMTQEKFEETIEKSIETQENLFLRLPILEIPEGWDA